MQRLNLTAFSEQSIDKSLITELKGGTGFCDWYLNYCNQRGCQPDPIALSRFMIRDGRYNNAIPNGTNMKALKAEVKRWGA